MPKLIVCCIRPGGLLSVNALSDVATAFARWRKGGLVFLPVAAFEADPEVVAGHAGLLKIPSIVPLAPHAGWVRRAPVETRARAAVLRQVRNVEPRIAAALLQSMQVLAPTG